MKNLFGVVLLVTTTLISITVRADDHATSPVPVEFWGCTFNDGYDMDKLMDWYGRFNKQVDGYKDQSYSAYIMTPMFSSEMTRVDFVTAGSWGSLASMGAGMQEFFGDGKGTALFAEFQEIATCATHTLFMSQQVRAATD